MGELADRDPKAAATLVDDIEDILTEVAHPRREPRGPVLAVGA